MTRAQYATIGLSILLLLVLYFGCETIPHKFRQLEKSRAIAAESADITLLQEEAKGQLSSEQLSALLSLEQQLEKSASDSIRAETLRQLSSQWFQLGYEPIAGAYAQQVAELVNSAESWAIAGSTYAIGLQKSKDETIKDFCAGRAVQAFENAVSLAPEDLSYKVNLALVYAERPEAENPMKGIQMLLELDRNNPDQPAVLFHLGRLGIRTGQYDKAIQRLEKVLALDPSRFDAYCLLAQAYAGLGNSAKAGEYEKKCTEANNDLN